MKLFGLFFSILIAIGCNAQPKKDNVFYQNWDKSPKEGSFKMDDWIVWGGSVVKGEDEKYYMFASRWPKNLTMSAWATNSEIVLAVSDTPQGPYKFKQVVLPARGKQYWDGMMTHNPNIHYHNGKYILFYIGITYDFEQPKNIIPTRELYEKAWNNKRIGIAIADSPTGPWKRMDKPIIEPRKNMWDGAVTSNPAAVIHEDGSVLLIYKSAPVPYPERNKNGTMRFGVAKADHYLGPYKRVTEDNKIIIKPIDTNVEDPYVWYDGTKYLMLAKCMNESITGEHGAGFIATSKNGIDWETPKNPIAYSKEVELSDGSKQKMPKLERPQVLLENGIPTYVFFACRNSKSEIFNIVRPIKQ